MRGNPVDDCTCDVPDRSIPACAGEPPGGSYTLGTGGVYPRVCGGTQRRWVSDIASGGLSPRVRGNRLFSRRLASAGGSIPACAGEPKNASGLRSWPRVYPRVCGGTCSPEARRTTTCGLSPRVRGNPAGDADCRNMSWSIPACAGEPTHHFRGLLPIKVYPRVCGGTVRMPLEDDLPSGLSPRVRGNRATGLRPGQGHRSIPACAGEPILTAALMTTPTVYPRVCGGTILSRTTTTGWLGLSPRVRGNLREGVRSTANVRSIPACAGEPAPTRGRRI